MKKITYIPYIRILRCFSHLKSQVFVLLVRQQAEDDSGGGPRPHADLDPGVSRRQRPQQLEVDVAAAVEGELGSHLSIRKNKRNPCSINSPAAGGNPPGYHSRGRAVLAGKKKNQHTHTVHARQGYLSSAAVAPFANAEFHSLSLLGCSL